MLDRDLGAGVDRPGIGVVAIGAAHGAPLYEHDEADPRTVDRAHRLERVDAPQREARAHAGIQHIKVDVRHGVPVPRRPGALIIAIRGLAYQRPRNRTEKTLSATPRLHTLKDAGLPGNRQQDDQLKRALPFLCGIAGWNLTKDQPGLNGNRNIQIRILWVDLIKRGSLINSA